MLKVIAITKVAPQILLKFLFNPSLSPLPVFSNPILKTMTLIC